MYKLKFYCLLAVILLSLHPVSAQDTTAYTVTAQSARVRDCASTTCRVLTTLSRGTTIEVLESVAGSTFASSNVWYRFVWQGDDAYIHSTLVTMRAAVQGGTGGQPPLPTAVRQGSRTAAPLLISTPAPENILSTPAAALEPAAAVCPNLGARCTELASCDQARACLAAGNNSLDRDRDGIPCESLCG